MKTTASLLPWVSERLDELGAETPVLFDETDGIDFEAVADTEPDVILAGYSGLTQEDYDTLSEIAPVVAYPEGPWATSWRDMIETNAAGMGMAAEGEQLVADLEQEIDDTVGQHPQLAGTNAMFLTHVDTTDLSEVSYYTPFDTRSAFFEDLGLATPGQRSREPGDRRPGVREAAHAAHRAAPRRSAGARGGLSPAGQPSMTRCGRLSSWRSGRAW